MSEGPAAGVGRALLLAAVFAVAAAALVIARRIILNRRDGEHEETWLLSAVPWVAPVLVFVCFVGTGVRISPSPCDDQGALSGVTHSV
jgi:hypothetical protein